MKLSALKLRARMPTRGGAVALAAFLVVAIPAFLLLGPPPSPSASPSDTRTRSSEFHRPSDVNPLLSGFVLDDPAQYELRKMCDDDGTCHENPAEATPRTVYSASDREQHIKWWKFHAALNSSAAVYASRMAEERSREKSDDPRKRRPLILLGDSITESWLGTGMGEPRSRAEGVPDVLRDLCNAEGFDAFVAAIGGDQTQHLLYRMGHGQVLPEYADDPEAVFVIMIGTNNLGSGILPGPTAEGVLAVAEYVMDHTRGRVVLFEILPRGDAKFGFLPAICPPRCGHDGRPLASFGPAVSEANAEIRNAAPDLAKRYGGRMSLVDCGGKFVPVGGGGSGREVMEDLMPDQLHPNAEGHRLLAKCFVDCIKGWGPN